MWQPYHELQQTFSGTADSIADVIADAVTDVIADAIADPIADAIADTVDRSAARTRDGTTQCHWQWCDVIFARSYFHHAMLLPRDCAVCRTPYRRRAVQLPRAEDEAAAQARQTRDTAHPVRRATAR